MARRFDSHTSMRMTSNDLTYMREERKAALWCRVSQYSDTRSNARIGCCGTLGVGFTMILVNVQLTLNVVLLSASLDYLNVQESLSPVELAAAAYPPADREEGYHHSSAVCHHNIAFYSPLTCSCGGPKSAPSTTNGPSQALPHIAYNLIASQVASNFTIHLLIMKFALNVVALFLCAVLAGATAIPTEIEPEADAGLVDVGGVLNDGDVLNIGL
ncbi:hypothetical protein C8Q80DRAFT_816277 [Daedaleopsis nitida]|nr:hypothetical protein C8Q80DRAFT_816277 [Daedaleopsis nitida]